MGIVAGGRRGRKFRKKDLELESISFVVKREANYKSSASP